MLRPLRLLLALLLLAPIACDVPDDDGSDDDATRDETTGDETTGDTDDEETTGVPTPFPFKPGLVKDCHASAARIGNCDR